MSVHGDPTVLFNLFVISTQCPIRRKSAFELSDCRDRSGANQVKIPCSSRPTNVLSRSMPVSEQSMSFGV
jgi:hypothetical protein